MIIGGCTGSYLSGRYYPGYRTVAAPGGLYLEPAEGKATFLFAYQEWIIIPSWNPGMGLGEGILVTVDQGDIRVGRDIAVEKATSAYYYGRGIGMKMGYIGLEKGTLRIEQFSAKGGRRVALDLPRPSTLGNTYSCRMGDPSLVIDVADYRRESQVRIAMPRPDPVTRPRPVRVDQPGPAD